METDNKHSQYLIKPLVFYVSYESELILHNLRTLCHLILKTTTHKKTNTNNPICKRRSETLSSFPRDTIQDSKIHSL